MCIRDSRSTLGAVKRRVGAIAENESVNELPVIKYFGRGKFDELSHEMRSIGQGDPRLTEAENTSIYAYTKSWYMQVNRKLRDGKVGAGSLDPDPLINKIDKAIEKLPKYEGSVTRGVHYPYEVFDELSGAKPGDVIGFRSYSSAAHSGAKDFGGNTQFIIDTKSARKVDHIAYEKREAEALIPRSTQFEIVNIDLNDNGNRMVVRLRELQKTAKQEGVKWY